MSGQDRHALGDPRISWTVLLTAALDPTVDPGQAASRLKRLAEREHWVEPYPVGASSKGESLKLSADHRYLDGQAMLVALGFLIQSSVESAASGVSADRERSSLLKAGSHRIAEIVGRPSAVVPPTGENQISNDALAKLRLERRATTSELIVAATQVIADRTNGPISMAIGVAQPSESASLADNSGYLRIADTRGLSRREVSDLLRTSPLQPGGKQSSGLLGAVAGAVTSRLADRLGSTLLVSHLGDVTAEGVTELAFYPVSGGASGLSLGAATLQGRTTLTLRARGHRHDSDGLQRLLEAIARILGD